METAYRFELENGTATQPSAKVRVYRRLRDGREKMEKYFSFPARTPEASLERRQAYIDGLLAAEQRAAQARAEQRAAQAEARKSATNPYKAGDLLYSSWGYEQTNIDFYQVTRTSGMRVYFRRIAGRLTEDGPSSMSGYKVPQPGQFLEQYPEVFCNARVYLPTRDGQPAFYLSTNGHSLSPTTPTQRHYCSWYA